MPIYGPWTTPPADQVDLTVNGSTTGVASHGVAAADGVSYAEKCESTVTGVVGTNQFCGARDNPPLVDVTQDLVFVRVNPAIAVFSDYIPSGLPSGATVEYEGGGPDQTWITAVDIDIPLETQNLSDVDTVVQARATVPPFDPITAGVTFLPGATLAGRALIGALTLPAGSTDAVRTVAVTVPGAAISEGSTGNWFAPALLHYDGQISHVGPTDGNQWLMRFTSSTPDFPVTVHYQPRRYRIVLPGRPPLAHRQRLDGAATAGPSLSHFQGAVSAARPDLAHRQHTP